MTNTRGLHDTPNATRVFVPTAADPSASTASDSSWTPRTTIRYQRALAGYEPAEALSTPERDRLMRTLCGYGWTDMHIAVHTLWSTYTVVRIRERLGIPINVQKGAA